MNYMTAYKQVITLHRTLAFAAGYANKRGTASLVNIVADANTLTKEIAKNSRKK